MSLEDLQAGLDDLESGCGHTHHGITLKSYPGLIEELIYCEFPECSSPLRVIRQLYLTILY